MTEQQRKELIGVTSGLAPADVDALIQVARFRARPLELEFNKGAPEVASATEYASSLANRAVSQVGELLRLGERAALSPAKGIVEKRVGAKETK